MLSSQGLVSSALMLISVWLVHLRAKSMTGGSLAAILWMFQYRDWKRGRDGRCFDSEEYSFMAHFISIVIDLAVSNLVGGYNLGRGYFEYHRDRVQLYRVLQSTVSTRGRKHIRV